MKYVLITFLLAAFSCGQQQPPVHAVRQSKTITKADSLASNSKQLPAKKPSRLIIAGESVGKIRLGANAALLQQTLGKPNTSDAAMGKAWLT